LPESRFAFGTARVRCAYVRLRCVSSSCAREVPAAIASTSARVARSVGRGCAVNVRRSGATASPAAIGPFAPSGESACEDTDVVVSVVTAHPEKARGVGHVAVVVDDEGAVVAESGAAHHFGEAVGGGDARRIRRRLVDKVYGVVQVDRPRNVRVAEEIASRPRLRIGAAVRTTACIDDA